MPKQNNTSMTPISNDPRDILGQPNIYKNITQPIKRNIPQSNPEIRYAGIQLVNNPPIIPAETRPEAQESEPSQINGKYLASLLGQGVAMVGAGIAGRDPMRVAETFNDMRLYQQRSDERQKQIDQAKKLMDPKSQESQRKRNLYKKVLSLPIPEDISASDLEDPVVLNSLKQQSIQAQMAKMPRQVGVAQAKEEKRKEPTEAERLSLGFAKRTENSDKMLSSLENNFIEGKDGFSPSQQFSFAPERFKSANRKNYEAAQIDFIGAVLRKESGASISDEEFERESKKYFPLPGDSPENIAYKQALRKQAINNLKTSANVKYVRDNQTGETIEIDPFGNILKRYK